MRTFNWLQHSLLLSCCFMSISFHCHSADNGSVSEFDNTETTYGSENAVGVSGSQASSRVASQPSLEQLIRTNREHQTTVTSSADSEPVTLQLSWRVTSSQTFTNSFYITTGIEQDDENFRQLSTVLPQLQELLSGSFSFTSITDEVQLFTRQSDSQMYHLLFTAGSGTNIVTLDTYLPGLHPALIPSNLRLTLASADPETPHRAILTLTTRLSANNMEEGGTTVASIIFERQMPVEQQQAPNLSIEFIREWENGYRMAIDISYLLNYDQLVSNRVDDSDSLPTLHALLERYLQRGYANTGNDAPPPFLNLTSVEEHADAPPERDNSYDSDTSTMIAEGEGEDAEIDPELASTPEEPLVDSPENTNHPDQRHPTHPATGRREEDTCPANTSSSSPICTSEGAHRVLPTSQRNKPNHELDEAIKNAESKVLEDFSKRHHTTGAPNLRPAISMIALPGSGSVNGQFLSGVGPLASITAPLTATDANTRSYGRLRATSTHPLTNTSTFDLPDNGSNSQSNATSPRVSVLLMHAQSIQNLANVPGAVSDNGYGDDNPDQCIPSNNFQQTPQTRTQRFRAWFERKTQQAANFFRRKK